MKKIFVLSLILCVIACKQNDDDSLLSNAAGSEIPFNPINSAIKGVVVDNAGTPIFDADVELINDNTSTNEVGYFSFESQEVNSEGTLLKVSAPGYFDAISMVTPSSNETFESIVMIPRSLTAIFNSEQGGLVATNGNATIEFASNVIANSDGTMYSGPVEVYAHWIDPSDYVALQSMPGDLRAINSQDEFGQLASFGMIVVELQTETGLPLNILDGMHATVSLPIQANQISLAEPTIPFWTLNEGTGYWEEEGEANLTGNNYVAEISHFTWINYDVFFDSIELDINLIHYITGSPMSGATVVILVDGIALSNYAQLDIDGKITLNVPRNEELYFGYFYSDCLFSSTLPITLFPLGSRANNFVFGGLGTAQFFSGNAVNISGNFLNCDGVPVTNGLVTTSVEGFESFALTSTVIDPLGNASSSFTSCEDEIIIKVYDFDQGTTPTVFTEPIPLSTNNISLSDEVICLSPPDEYLTINWDGQTVTFTDLTYGLSLSPYNILEINNFDGRIDQDHWVSIAWQDISPSVGEVEHLTVLKWLPDYEFGSNLMHGAMNITEFGGPGEDIKGTLEGVFPAALSNLSVDVPYNGSFSIKNE